jgi:hypothetical protein
VIFVNRENARVAANNSFACGQRQSSLAILIKAVLVFSLSYLALFFPMSLRPNIYDEGLVLTAAMRVTAGQIPHRDFYANYGPAQFYILAGLFKLFGTSILVERLCDLFVKAFLVALIYVVISSHLSRSVVAGTCVVTVLWLLGLLDSLFGLAVTPVSLLNLAGSILVLSVFRRPASKRSMFAAGAIAGAATLFRYDTGMALVGINACVIAIAVCLPLQGTLTKLRVFASTFVPYLLGFAVMILPPVLYYLSVASVHPFIRDIVFYPSKYYHSGRNLPFPGITLKQFDNSTVYAIILIVCISLGVVVVHLLRVRGTGESSFQDQRGERNWYGFLIAFGFLALGMYFKGLVRLTLIHLYLAIIPSLLLLAMLVEHRSTFPRAVRVSVMCLTGLFVSSAVWSALREVRNLHLQHSSLVENVWSSARGTSPEVQVDWCKTRNPLTRGICFLPDDDHIRTIEFIASHTSADQKLFVGLTRHDRIFANDNLLYFATQRLPATRWSHFDPGLQNRFDIQAEIIHELDLNVPPYVVRDSEFDLVREPNDSSKSSGVTLLDEYLAVKYQRVQTFGALSVWRRRGTVS